MAEMFSSAYSLVSAVSIVCLRNAGNVSAIWKGFREWKRLGRIKRLPKIFGVQAVKSAPIARTLRSGASYRPVTRPETVATAIRIGAPVNWRKAVAAIQDSGGQAGTVTDREILEAQRDLARTEGLFVEPASAAPVAYLRKKKLKGFSTVVCVTTGHGLKDPDALRHAPVRMKRIKPQLAAIQRLLDS